MGEVTVPFLNYKVPTVALLIFALFLLFFFHLGGLRFATVVGASAGIS